MSILSFIKDIDLQLVKSSLKPVIVKKNKRYTKLILCGGALRALSLIGSMHYLDEIGILKNIKEYVCTSIGGVIAFLHIIGYNFIEIMNIFKDNFDDFQKINYANINDILENFGLGENEILNKILHEKLKEKLNGFVSIENDEIHQKTIIKDDDITFLEFSKKYGVNLVISGTNLTKRNTDYFSISNEPNMSVITALMITTCMPIIYNPIKYNNNLYIDGGLFENFPISYYKDNKGKDIFGIMLLTSSANNDDFASYLINMINSTMVMANRNPLMDEMIKDKDICIIEYYNSLVNDIENKKDKIDEYYINGYNIIKNIFKNKNNLK
jgi:predicted acylesterase/phospholipase RssA